MCAAVESPERILKQASGRANGRKWAQRGRPWQGRTRWAGCGRAGRGGRSVAAERAGRIGVCACVRGESVCGWRFRGRHLVQQGGAEAAGRPPSVRRLLLRQRWLPLLRDPLVAPLVLPHGREHKRSSAPSKRSTRQRKGRGNAAKGRESEVTATTITMEVGRRKTGKPEEKNWGTRENWMPAGVCSRFTLPGECLGVGQHGVL